MPSTTVIKLRPSTLSFDIPPAETGPEAYTYGFNAQFKDGYAEKSLGWEQIFPAPTGVPQYLLNVTDPTNNYWICACADRILVTDTVSWFDITPTDGTWVAPTDKNQWTGGMLNGVAFLNNGQSYPWYWNGSTGSPMLALPDWPANTTCGALRAFKFHLIAMNITTPSGNFADQVVWSAAAAPGAIPQEWTPSASNDAGDLQLSSTPIPIIDGAVLRDTFVIYKQHATYLMQYVGGSFVFNSRSLFGSSGILARNCVVEYEGNHYVLTDGDVIRHDGNNLLSIVYRRDKQGLFDAMNTEFYQSCFVVLNKQRNEIMFCYPNGTDEVPSWAMCYDTKGDAIGLRQIGAAEHIGSGAVTVSGFSSDWDSAIGSWDDQVGAWDSAKYSAAEDGLLIANSAESLVYYMDAAIQQDGLTTFFGLAKEYFDFGAPGQNKTCVRLWPKVSKATTGTLQIRVGATATATAPIDYGSYYSFSPGVDEYVDVVESGRYLSFQFTAYAGKINMIGFDVELRNGGGRY